MSKIKGLSAEEIIEVVKEFLDNQIYNYSLLIDGTWGSGKTFFLKSLLIPAINSHEKEKKEHQKGYHSKKVLYISLYGISSIEKIQRKLTTAYMLEKANRSKYSDKKRKSKFRVDEKHLRRLSVGLKMTQKPLNKLGIDLKSWNISIEDFISYKHRILVFDDLERCRCDINEVLGYINSFVEHQGVKVILIANEQEICGAPTKEADESNKDESNKDDQKMDSEYSRIKEKLIGNTIQYIPNLHNSYVNLIQKCITDYALKLLLFKSLNQDVERALEADHLNLRTYQFYLTCIAGIYDKLGKYKREYEILEKVRLYTFQRCIQYKSGDYTYTWSDKTFYGAVNLSRQKGLSGYVLGFKFIDDYILRGYLNSVEIKEALDNYVDEITREKKDREESKVHFYNLRDNWLVYTEEEVKQQLDKIYSELFVGDYSVQIYPKILALLARFETLGFEKATSNKFLNQMIQNIKEDAENRVIDFGDVYLDDEEVRQRYDALVAPLKEELITIQNQSKVEEVNECLNDDQNWGRKLYDWVKKSNATDYKSFLRDIDMNKLWGLIKKSDNENLTNFVRSIYKLYGFSNINQYYKDDIPNVESLIEKLELEDFSSCDLIKQYLLKELKRVLEDKCESLKS